MAKGKYKKNAAPAGMEIEDYVLTATEKEAAKMERPLDKAWLGKVWLGVVFLLVILAGRVFYVSAIKGAYYLQVAKGNSVRSIIIKAPRGRITDRRGISLVSNVPSMDVVAIPADLPKDSERRKAAASQLAAVLSMNEADIWGKMENADPLSLNPILIKENISQNESLVLDEKLTGLPGINLERTAIRNYSDSEMFSHVLGYEGKITQAELNTNKGYVLTDYIGKQGIEKAYENYLRGVDGATQIEVDSLGNAKREIGVINPKPGSDLVLSLDADLQKKIYASLENILQTTKTKTAAAVALDPKSGQVLAMVSIPSYNNNLFAKKISADQYNSLLNDPDQPLFNRAISGQYPPGSTIKPAIATAALSEGVINQSTIIDGLGGTLRIGNFSFGDWKVHGPSEVRTAIAQSNDIFFYTVGGGYGNISGLGMSRMKKWDNLFGFGAPTGIDIGGEASGLIPDEQWKLDKIKEKWSLGNSYHAAIGQGYVTATPLQLANYVAAIANGGTLYKPQLVSQIKKANGETISIPAEVIRSGFVSPDVLKVVQEGMRQTITDGTATPLKDLPVSVAGKTGTAQFGVGAKLAHGWLITYAPYENPQIAMVVLVEGGGEGFTSALPVTKEVYQWYFGGRN